MDPLEQYAAEITDLRLIRDEYQVTVRVLAVVVELLLAEVGGDTIEISDETLARSPDLRAWREPAKNTVAITVSREP